MNSSKARRCLHCNRPLRPDYRNAYHQRFCSAAACQQASKQTSQRRWLRKPENRAYFCGPHNVLRVQIWRRDHHGYWRSNHHGSNQILENFPAVEPERNPTAKAVPRLGTLQEFCRSKMTAIAEQISRLGRCALQEDIASCVSQMISEAQCILQRCNLHVLPPGQLELPINYHESG